MLSEAGYDYAEIPLPHTIRSKALGAIAKAQTVPQVFVGGRLIGGSEELAKFLARPPQRVTARSAVALRVGNVHARRLPYKRDALPLLAGERMRRRRSETARTRDCGGIRRQDNLRTIRRSACSLRSSSRSPCSRHRSPSLAAGPAFAASAPAPTSAPHDTSDVTFAGFASDACVISGANPQAGPNGDTSGFTALRRQAGHCWARSPSSGSKTLDGVNFNWRLHADDRHDRHLDPGGRQNVTLTSCSRCMRRTTAVPSCSTTRRLAASTPGTWEIDWLNNGGQVPDYSNLTLFARDIVTTPVPGARDLRLDARRPRRDGLHGEAPPLAAPPRDGLGAIRGRRLTERRCRDDAIRGSLWSRSGPRCRSPRRRLAQRSVAAVPAQAQRRVRQAGEIAPHRLEVDRVVVDDEQVAHDLGRASGARGFLPGVDDRVAAQRAQSVEAGAESRRCRRRRSRSRPSAGRRARRAAARARGTARAHALDQRLGHAQVADLLALAFDEDRSRRIEPAQRVPERVSNAFCVGCALPGTRPSTEPRWLASASRSSTCAPWRRARRGGGSCPSRSARRRRASRSASGSASSSATTARRKSR